MVQIFTDVCTFRAGRSRGRPRTRGDRRRHRSCKGGDKPYKWHVNDGAEAFVVLHGEVDVPFRRDGLAECIRLKLTDIFLAEEGDEHVAHPVGEARILVIERKGSA